MYIKLSPYVVIPGDSTDMEVSVSGDLIAINGTDFDFSPLPEGAELPAVATGSDYFEGSITRVDGEIRLTLKLPISSDASEEARFPAPIHVTWSGPVELPK
ncbi:hypothetical protein FDG94_gp072 [Pseudomonas phage SM1]|uniref:Uncharacterized protein n=1 Tax=Pseudomonas phage SM1 TaxID=1772332 RepID=A0A0U3DIY4_9CAUD|nr:hypothetical protein FDG94_gp072 [Pseudomonas phage SM1]ALT58064.1 hypothetical protein SM1_072 [Pseudomonas phage SM1]UVN14111.1 hypothetical protein FBPa45_0110 [Pseudomonas phage vB_PaeS_FBPa45]